MHWTANRTFTLILGIVFTLLGLLGFLASSTMAHGNILGFDVDLVHNLIHLITGLIALVTVFAGGYRTFNQVFGVIYLLLGVAGLFYPALYFDGRLLGITHVNAVDHVLHLIAGGIAAYLGFGVRETSYDYERQMDQATRTPRTS